MCVRLIIMVPVLEGESGTQNSFFSPSDFGGGGEEETSLDGQARILNS